MAKSRTGAQRLTSEGRVRVNREKTLVASHSVKPGDVLTVALPNGTRVLKIVAPGTRRGPPAEAASLFEDLTPKPEPASAETPRSDFGSRPDKRGRRALMALKRAGSEDISGEPD